MQYHRVDQDKLWTEAGKKLIFSLDPSKKNLLLLSGGSAVNIYKSIADCQLPIENLAFGQADERFRPKRPERDQSSKLKNQNLNGNINRDLISRTGLWKRCEEKGIPYHLISQEGSLEESADEYNKTMEQLFNEYENRVAVLGIGEDGHTAGLIPGFGEKWDVEKYAAGYELTKHSNLNLKTQNSKPYLKSLNPKTKLIQFRKRISLTPFALRQLDRAVVVATGERKKEVIERIMNYESGMKNINLNEFPAAIIREIPRVNLFTDAV